MFFKLAESRSTGTPSYSLVRVIPNLINQCPLHTLKHRLTTHMHPPSKSHEELSLLHREEAPGWSNTIMSTSFSPMLPGSSHCTD